MSTTGHTSATYRILVSGSDKVIEETDRIETNTNCYPGRGVIKGTNDDECSVAGVGGMVIGWLGYETCNKNDMPATRGTIYAANAHAPVIHGPGIILMAQAATTLSITKGELLTMGASGELTKAITMVTTAGTVAVTANGDDATITGSLPVGGLPVAKAMETVNTSGGAQLIQVMSLI